MNTKWILESKTFWLNAISALLEIAQLATGTNWIPAGTLTIIVNILNILLRHLSTPSATSLLPPVKE